MQKGKVSTSEKEKFFTVRVKQGLPGVQEHQNLSIPLNSNKKQLEAMIKVLNIVVIATYPITNLTDDERVTVTKLLCVMGAALPPGPFILALPIGMNGEQGAEIAKELPYGWCVVLHRWMTGEEGAKIAKVLKRGRCLCLVKEMDVKQGAIIVKALNAGAYMRIPTPIYVFFDKAIKWVSALQLGVGLKLGRFEGAMKDKIQKAYNKSQEALRAVDEIDKELNPHACLVIHSGMDGEKALNMVRALPLGVGLKFVGQMQEASQATIQKAYDTSQAELKSEGTKRKREESGSQYASEDSSAAHALLGLDETNTGKVPKKQGIGEPSACD